MKRLTISTKTGMSGSDSSKALLDSLVIPVPVPASCQLYHLQQVESEYDLQSQLLDSSQREQRSRLADANQRTNSNFSFELDKTTSGQKRGTLQRSCRAQCSQN